MCQLFTLNPVESPYEPTYDYFLWARGETMDDEVKQILPDNADQLGKLRVLMVTPFYGDGGGVGNCAIDLAGSLRRLGVVVDVLHWWPNLGDPAFVTSDGARTTLSSVGELFESRREYDLLHFQSAAYSDRINGKLTRILERFDIPVVYTIHSLAAYHADVMKNPEEMRNNIADQVELMGKARRVVLLTEDILDIARRHHPEHEGRFTVIENGTHPPAETPELLAGQTALSARLRPRGDERLILYVGRISREKGIYELAAALPGILEAVPDAKLVIAGNKKGDPNVARIEAAWAERGLVAGVHYELVGWVEGAEKAALYALCDCVVIPSHYEHMPLTALEAMAHGKLVVINDIESLRGTFQTLDPERRCVLPIESIADPRNIVDALRWALERPEETAEVVARGRALVSSRFTWEKIAERVLGLYREVLRERDAEEAARFHAAFEARFQELFRLGYEGTLAVNMGDHRRGAELLCAAFALNPDNREIHGHLERALRPRILELREELVRSADDPGLLDELQRCSEVLRRILYEVPAAEAPAKVAAVMPVFLKEAHKGPGLSYLVEAVDSVLAQDYASPLELLLVNDASEVDVGRFLLDHYGKLVSSITDEDGAVLHQGPGDEGRRIRLIQKKTNSGNDVAPRNLAIFAALRSGIRYIGHIDSDDRWLPDRVSASLAHLERADGTDLLHGRHRCIDERGQLLTGTKIDGWYNFARKFTFGMDQHDPRNHGRTKRHSRPEIEVLMKDNWIHGGTVLYQSNVVLRVGRENMAPTRRYGADHDYWKKISRVATIDYLSKILAEHRVHEGSMTLGGR
ncbi:glycosyltransferase [Sorangium sp. So ce233]|uniref:glycosyltransferase n=1 Tax=Sorangium sp. So ce233 TaxID=3133290 RepID=UPI003F625B8E